jgi:hypothetical protein
MYTRKNHHVVAGCQQLVHDCSEQVAAMLCCTLSTRLVNNIVHACSNNVVNAWWMNKARTMLLEQRKSTWYHLCFMMSTNANNVVSTMNKTTWWEACSMLFLSTRNNVVPTTLFFDFLAGGWWFRINISPSCDHMQRNDERKNVCFIIGILKFNSSKYKGKYNNYYANTMYSKVFLKYIRISKLVYIKIWI